MDDLTYFSKIRQNLDGDLYIAIPPELAEAMGWETGDSIEWAETTVYEDDEEEESVGFTLINVTKGDT